MSPDSSNIEPHDVNVWNVKGVAQGRCESCSWTGKSFRQLKGELTMRNAIEKAGAEVRKHREETA